MLRSMKWLLTSWLGNDQLGSEAVRAQLLADGVWSRETVQRSLVQIEPRVAALQYRKDHREDYSVAGPNTLRHLDGKLATIN